MMHIIIGLFFIALGVWGVFDEWYYVVDFLKGSGSVLLILVGSLAIFAGAVGRAGRRAEQLDGEGWPEDDDLLDPDLEDAEDDEEADGGGGDSDSDGDGDGDSDGDSGEAAGDDDESDA